MKALDDLRGMLFSRLGELLASHGFKPNKKNQVFQLKTSTGHGTAHLAFIRHPGVDFDVVLDFDIRFDAVESLANDISPLVKPAEKKRIATMGMEYGNLTEGAQRRWTIAISEDIEPVAQSIAHAVISIGIPYINKYSDMSEALRALGGTTPFFWRHMPLHSKRASRSIILAYLLQDEPTFERLVLEHDDYLLERNDIGLPKFRELVSILRGKAFG